MVRRLLPPSCFTRLISIRLSSKVIDWVETLFIATSNVRLNVTLAIYKCTLERYLIAIFLARSKNKSMEIGQHLELLQLPSFLSSAQ